MTTRAIAIEAALELEPGTDTRAPGGAVTVALCGHWEHDGPCRWPHNNRLDPSTAPARLRTVAIVDDETAAEVVTRVESGLRQDPRWTVVRYGVTGLVPGELALAERLAGSG
jgi:hypothetical protein